ncbi:MAG: 5-formyltetrahydrofolate cyclo-ligase [Kiritimatiellae bacterium]|nr:5-formyltetrahydrofolate cyclo-ligase [Kiritimatiellia bacterium]MDW8458862.1 5-formyltetrahydrofolate cyclo-ligase [Verrucomicrobiota bacterium]
MNPKAVARQAAQRIRNKLSFEWIAEASIRAQQRLLDLPEFQRAKTVALYRPRPREVATDLLLAACRKEAKTVLLPAWDKERGEYRLARWNEGAPLQSGLYGIEEPVERIWVPGSETDFIVVTALAFDIYGFRLGHGGGHFDRLLADVRGTKACLAFECQKLTAVPVEPHDVQLDVIATEKALYRAPARLVYADPEALRK